MSLVPYALRPRTVLRKAAVKRGPTGNSVLWKAAAIYFVGGPIRLRSTAIRLGFSGGNRKWQAVGAMVLLTHDLRRVLGKQSEPLGSWKAGTDSFVKVTTSKPLSKKVLKRSGTTRKALRAAVVARAVADTTAKNPDARIVVKTK
jgi:hypothetical protein